MDNTIIHYMFYLNQEKLNLILQVLCCNDASPMAIILGEQ